MFTTVKQASEKWGVGHKEAFDFVSELVKDHLPISESIIKQIHYVAGLTVQCLQERKEKER